MAKLFKNKEEESKVETPIVESVETPTPEVTPVVETKEILIAPVVEVKSAFTNLSPMLSIRLCRIFNK